MLKSLIESGLAWLASAVFLGVILGIAAFGDRLAERYLPEGRLKRILTKQRGGSGPRD